MVRALSLPRNTSGGATSDDATIFLVAWRGGDADHLAALDWLRQVTRMPM
ncbi:hypothetical protein [Streptomyces coeruleorubidus]